MHHFDMLMLTKKGERETDYPSASGSKSMKVGYIYEWQLNCDEIHYNNAWNKQIK